MPVRLNTASGGSVTLDPANTASNFTLTVPAQTGTVVAATASGDVAINGSITAGATGGEGGQINFNNPDNASVGLNIDVSSADIGRIFSIRNNSQLQIGQLAGTGGIISFVTAGAERGRFDASGNFLFNSGYGSFATAYGCRAWVNFNGTGTVAIRASGNVSSITDNGTGDYTVNFTTAMPDANYSFTLGATLVTNGSNGTFIYNPTTSAPAAGSIRIMVISAGALYDSTNVCVAIFR